MGSAYTPGLTVSARTTITKTRRLPLKGDVLVERGAQVGPDTVVARADLPGIMQTLKVAAALGIDPGELPDVLAARRSARASKKARSSPAPRGLFGLFKAEYKAGASGTVELVSNVSGNVGVREAPTPVEIAAYIPGTIREVMPGEGVVIEAQGALIQGIFGIGGERRALLKRVSSGPDAR